MPASPLFTALSTRVANLTATMLPPTRADLAYTEAEYDRVRGYILLIHAEIESFVETRVIDEMRARHDDWVSTGKANNVVMGMLAFSDGAWPSVIGSLDAPGSVDRKWEARDVEARLKICLTQCHRQSKENHGIKAKDTLALLLRLGFRASEIEKDLISEMDSFGTYRGEFAHNAVQRVTRVPDPVVTRKRVESILEKLQILDAKISSII